MRPRLTQKGPPAVPPDLAEVVARGLVTCADSKLRVAADRIGNVVRWNPRRPTLERAKCIRKILDEK